MRVLIDVLHPAHVHFFRPLREELLTNGSEVLVLARDKDVTEALLDEFQIRYCTTSTAGSRGLVRLGGELLTRSARTTRIIRRWSPDVLLGIMGPSIALAGRMTGTPAVVFYDTEVARMTNSWVYPMASAVVTPTSYRARVRGNHVTYPGYQELAYLHPNRFSANPEELARFDLGGVSPFVILRLVGWTSTHDVQKRGLKWAEVEALIAELEQDYEVRISSERPLPHDLQSHRLEGPASSFHHVLSFAKGVVSESATVATEASILGTPTAYVASDYRGYIDELEGSYGLVAKFDALGTDLTEWIRDLDSATAMWKARRRDMLAEKVDVTAWIYEFLEESYGT